MENFFDLTRKRQERQPVTNTSNSESGGSRTANPIWEFFVEQSNGKARCNKCGNFLSLGSKEPHRQTTQNLKNHLSSKHPIANESFKQKISKCEEEKSGKKRKASDEVATSKAKLVQLKISDVEKAKKIQLWTKDHPAVERIDKNLMDLIIVDMLPYSIVEGEAFKRLNLNDPLLPRRYEAKSEKYFRTTLMPNTYERVKAKVKNVLKEAEYISFTTDIWSKPSKSCSLLSFTAHFVKEAVRHKVVLAASVLDLDHAGEYIAQKLTDTLLTWGIESKIHIGVRDNAANMVSAMRKANIDDFGCMAYTLQLVIRDSIFTQEVVETIVKKTRKIVGHFKHSEQACRHLTHYQNCLKVPNHCMIQDVGTRWNSTFLMLQRAAEQRMAINLYSLERKGIDTLSNTE